MGWGLLSQYSPSCYFTERLKYKIHIWYHDHSTDVTVVNRPISQIPQCIRQISHNVHISVTKCCIVGYGTDAFWDLWDGSINCSSMTPVKYRRDLLNKHVLLSSNSTLVTPTQALLIAQILEATAMTSRWEDCVLEVHLTFEYTHQLNSTQLKNVYL